jgi:hypothetical protein
LNGSKALFQQFAEKFLAKGLDPAREAKKQQLISPWPAAMIHSCPVSPVVAAVLRFARRGDLGLAIRSTSKVPASPRYSTSCRGLSVSIPPKRKK